MIEKYLEKNGSVCRSMIAADVMSRKLSADEIQHLCEYPEVQAAFIGKTYADKKPKTCWNKEYLERLFCAVVADSFNLDYLLYLREVADFVAAARIKKIVVAGVVIVLVIVAGRVVLRYIL